MTTAYIGKPVGRVDGRAKVTGAAKYAAEYDVPDLVYGVVVSSAIAKGKITRIDASEALNQPGVVQVFTHENAPRLASHDRNYRDRMAPLGSPFRPLYDAEIKFSAQPVALVVAESFELARYAASLIRVEYQCELHATDLMEKRGSAFRPKPKWGPINRLLIPLTGVRRLNPQERQRAGSLFRPLTMMVGFPPSPKPRGHAEAAFAKAAVRLEAEFRLPVEHHNPMELFATTVVRSEDGKLTVYDKTQGVQNVHNYLRSVFGLSKDDLHVVSPFVGGAFGSGLRPQYQAFLAVMAARELKRSIRVSLTRQQMFSLGHRPATWQRVALGAATDGTLEAVLHEAVSETSRFEDYSDAIVDWSGMLYRCDNVKLDHKIVQLDLPTPLDMRAPGAAWGVYALECAVDELAFRLGIDPIQLRLMNYAEKDQNQNKQFSSKELRACYQAGAEEFGWTHRDPEPRSMREGNTLIGWGMAGGVWGAEHLIASAKAVLTADGRLKVSSATMDIGTGTYTVMSQIAAETLGLPMEDVTFELGDSSLPTAPAQAGSFTVSTVGTAVKVVCDNVCTKVFKLARQVRDSPLADAHLKEVTFADGHIRLTRDPSRAISIRDVMRHGKVDVIEAKGTAFPHFWKGWRYSRHSHSAVFAEVRVDEDLGTVEVARIVSAVASGRILNPKMARSQILGGVVWGIGMALEEESVIDHAFGRFMNHNLADYHIPVNADVHDVDVIFVEEHDEVVNPLGVKGLGEIGIVGVAPAIANAVFHATGKRVRDLPITLDKLL
jgi:xanthine dehydrogenase YagR molybdenum-binding subunit